MNPGATFTLDGRTIPFQPGQTILQAADAAGVPIPRLCAHPDLPSSGACRVCTVEVNGAPQAACTYPAAAGLDVRSDTPELAELRAQLVEMLFAEGNHFCMCCEKSGGCELQDLAYRLGIRAPRYPALRPHRPVDATHPEVWIDHQRCILCGRCVLASQALDGRSIFHFHGRGPARRIGVNADAGLAGTAVQARDRAVALCPVGALLRKRQGFLEALGRRRFDRDAAVPPAATPGPSPAAGSTARPRLATLSLAGCFGCHMSLLDIDHRLLDLFERVDLDRSPFTDHKHFTGRCAIGLVEGGCGNEENVRQLVKFRAHCERLVTLGECAGAGGVPALRQGVPIRACLDEAYRDGPSVFNPGGVRPDDPELPRLLDRIYPCAEVVRVDYHLPGCPPAADAIWHVLQALLAGVAPELPHELIRYD